MNEKRDLSITWSDADFPGKLIVVSGLDGSGKTTSVGMIMEYLEAKSVDASMVKLPSKNVTGLSYFKAYGQDHGLHETGEVDLFALCLVLDGDNLMTLRTKVLPRLLEGKTVVCDRFVYESIAEMAANPVSEADLETLIGLYARYPKPDLGIITNPPVETAIGRVRERLEERDHVIQPDLWGRFSHYFQQVAKDNGLPLLPTNNIEETRSVLKRHLDALYGF